MRKQIVEYVSPTEALVTLLKQLGIYENQYQMNSADFFTQYSQGKTGDSEAFVDWAGNYQHYLAIREELDSKLQDTN